MSAKDYEFVSGIAHVYLARKLKTEKYISDDRREISADEIISLCEWYVKEYCVLHNSSDLHIAFGGEEILHIEAKGKLLEEIKEELACPENKTIIVT
jgi:hypothetical protein